jgi:anti-sigma B factor antagonist
MFAIQHQNLDGACRIAVSGEMTIYSATEMKEKLLAAAAGSQHVDIDLADVSEFDSAGVQLLALLRKTAGGAMRVVEAGASVRDLLDLYNLSAEWMAAAGTPATNLGSTS